MFMKSIPCQESRTVLVDTLERTGSLSALFLGAFAKLRKATISFVKSVCPSAWKNSALLNGFSWNLVSEYFSKICSKKFQVSLKSDKNNGYFTWRPMYIYDKIWWILLRMRSVSDKFVEKIKTHILCSPHFCSKILPFMGSCEKVWYSQKGHRWQYNTAHALCMLDN
jgi:hypothetical protein